MTTKHITNLLFCLSLLFCILMLGACTKDEEEMMIVFPEDLDCDEEIGAFSLLPGSLSYTPYPGRDSVSFVDSLGNSIVFSLEEGELIEIKGAMIKYDVYVPGDTVRYCYQTERKSFEMEHKGEDLRFILTIESSPDYNLSAPGKVSDVFNIWYSYPDPPPYGSSQVFFATIAPRTGSYTDQNIVIPEMKVFGKTFSEVERTNFSSPAVVVWYNRTEGIVCFKTPDGKRWRFDGFK